MYNHVYMIDDILQYNREFVARKGYEPFITDKYPSKKLAVLTCMDTRLTELLPKALGLRNGDAKIIRNAGGLILSSTDSAIRSLLVGIYELGVEEVMVVHHSNCGACHMSFEEFKPLMLGRGVSPETLKAVTLRNGLKASMTPRPLSAVPWLQSLVIHLSRRTLPSVVSSSIPSPVD